MNMNLLHTAKTQPDTIGIFVIWLFHISAIIGISIGYQEWFIEKTPLNLAIIFLVLIVLFPINNGKTWILFLLCFLTGMIVEWLGVKYGYIFGSYEYGANLGPKLDGVPWFIGVNWGILTFISAGIANLLSKNILLKAIIGAALMVLIDLPMEKVAPIFDYWSFDLDPVPLSNYIGWFSTSFILHLVLQWQGIQGNSRLVLHTYIAQFTFFSYFYVYYSI